KLDVAHAAVAERGAERVQRLRALAKLHPVDLHLVARRGLEAHHRLRWLCRLEHVHERAQLAGATLIALRHDLTHQDRGRNPVRMRRRLAFAQVRLEGRQLRHPLDLARVARQPRRRQVRPHRVHRAPHLGGDPPKAQPVTPQQFDFHIHLVCDHPGSKWPDLLNSVYQLSIGSPYQLTSGSDSPSFAANARGMATLTSVPCGVTSIETSDTPEISRKTGKSAGARHSS